MSHFTVSAIFPFDEDISKMKELVKNNKNSLIDKLSSKIEKPFNYYDIDREVGPYKDYIENEEIERIAGYHNIDCSNLQSIEDKLIDWRGEDGVKTGIDEKGLFIVSRVNKEGKFDYWTACDVYLIDELLNDENFVSHAIFTPDCKFIESEEWFYHVGESNQESFKDWSKKFREILKKYSPNAFILLIDCHI